ncbi:MAG TPA: SRPBCC domain-containing protein [Myxococcota bacterium]|nr:SRPBCC domain-containing protein [Myxococcota bacterium]
MATIRQQVLIDAPMRSVWNAITTPEGIARWWATSARVDGREGGRVALVHLVDGESVEERGMIHRFRPTATFELLLDGVGRGPDGASRSSSIQFQLGRGAGETKLHVIVTGASLDDDEARVAQEAAWKDRLLRLRDGLEASA